MWLKGLSGGPSGPYCSYLRPQANARFMLFHSSSFSLKVPSFIIIGLREAASSILQPIRLSCNLNTLWIPAAWEKERVSEQSQGQNTIKIMSRVIDPFFPPSICQKFPFSYNPQVNVQPDLKTVHDLLASARAATSPENAPNTVALFAAIPAGFLNPSSAYLKLSATWVALRKDLQFQNWQKLARRGRSRFYLRVYPAVGLYLDLVF